MNKESYCPNLENIKNDKKIDYFVDLDIEGKKIKFFVPVINNKENINKFFQEYKEDRVVNKYLLKLLDKSYEELRKNIPDNKKNNMRKYTEIIKNIESIKGISDGQMLFLKYLENYAAFASEKHLTSEGRLREIDWLRNLGEGDITTGDKKNKFYEKIKNIFGDKIARNMIIGLLALMTATSVIGTNIKNTNYESKRGTKTNIVSSQKKKSGGFIEFIKNKFVNKESEKNNEPNIYEKLMELEKKIDSPVYIDKNEFIRIKNLEIGSILYTNDIVYYLDLLSKDNFNNDIISEKKINSYKQTIKLLLSAKQLWPQAVKFQVFEESGKVSLKPVDWIPNIEIKQKIDSQILVVGGEFESVAAAVYAADQGYKVDLLYSGPLGGLTSDEGGNMRFYDAVTSVKMPPSQVKLMQEALGMEKDNFWSMPNNITPKLLEYIQKKYKNQINIIKTDNLSFLHVKTEGKKITAIITKEGVEINVTNSEIIDTDPELTIADKINLPQNIKTPNIAYGVVFDIKNISPSEIKEMSAEEKFNPDSIINFLPVKHDEISRDEKLTQAYRNFLTKYQININSNKLFDKSNGQINQQLTDELCSKYYLDKDYFLEVLKNYNYQTIHPNKYVSYGFRQAGDAFDFYMNVQEYMARKDGNIELANRLDKLNKIRIMTGFNVAIRKDGATFNSISYSMNKTYKQGDHNLSDPEFDDIRMDLDFLKIFFSKIMNKNLDLVTPSQMYVRRPNGVVLTKEKLDDKDFNQSPFPNMKYYNDCRGLRPMDKYDEIPSKIDKINEKFNNQILSWNIDSETVKTAQTDFDNLCVTGKSAASSKYVGALRIIQGNILLNEKIIESFSKSNKEYNNHNNTYNNLNYNPSNYISINEPPVIKIPSNIAGLNRQDDSTTINILTSGSTVVAHDNNDAKSGKYLYAK